MQNAHVKQDSQGIHANIKKLVDFVNLLNVWIMKDAKNVHEDGPVHIAQSYLVIIWTCVLIMVFSLNI